MRFLLRPVVRMQPRTPHQIARRAPAFTSSLLPAVLLACSLSVFARAGTLDLVPDDVTIAQLEQRALEAAPREQCFLYTELVHGMTLRAGKQLSDGDNDKAAATLQQINKYAHLIHVNLAKDTKRLKNAEMLMQHTTFRLAEVLHLVSGEDRSSVQATLKQLSQVNDEILNQVFLH